jgi:hypothetical protein
MRHQLAGSYVNKKFLLCQLHEIRATTIK